MTIRRILLRSVGLAGLAATLAAPAVAQLPHDAVLTAACIFTTGAAGQTCAEVEFTVSVNSPITFSRLVLSTEGTAWAFRDLAGGVGSPFQANSIYVGGSLVDVWSGYINAGGRELVAESLSGPVGPTKSLTLRAYFGAVDPATGTLAGGGFGAPSGVAGEFKLANKDAPPKSYAFSGFRSPVKNPPQWNRENAGRNLPMKWSLGGDQGMKILVGGTPLSQRINCSTMASMGPEEPTSGPGRSGLKYSKGADEYHYNWKTDRTWRGTCRQFLLKLDDGSTRIALFNFP